MLLLPFQIYVIIAPLWLYVWEILTRDFRTRYMYHEEAVQISRGYEWSFLILVLAAIIQFKIGLRQSAWVSSAFAVITFGIYYHSFLGLSK